MGLEGAGLGYRGSLGDLLEEDSRLKNKRVSGRDLWAGSVDVSVKVLQSGSWIPFLKQRNEVWESGIHLRIYSFPWL